MEVINEVKNQKKNLKISTIDLFCGVGGLTNGLKKAKIKVKGGFDIDTSCQFAYEKNNKTKFYNVSVTEIENQERESKRYFLNFVTNLKSEIIMQNHLMVSKPES